MPRAASRGARMFGQGPQRYAGRQPRCSHLTSSSRRTRTRRPIWSTPGRSPRSAIEYTALLEVRSRPATSSTFRSTGRQSKSRTVSRILLPCLFLAAALANVISRLLSSSTPRLPTQKRRFPRGPQSVAEASPLLGYASPVVRRRGHTKSSPTGVIPGASATRAS